MQHLPLSTSLPDLYSEDEVPSKVSHVMGSCEENFAHMMLIVPTVAIYRFRADKALTRSDDAKIRVENELLWLSHVEMLKGKCLLESMIQNAKNVEHEGDGPYRDTTLIRSFVLASMSSSTCLSS